MASVPLQAGGLEADLMDKNKSRCESRRSLMGASGCR